MMFTLLLFLSSALAGDAVWATEDVISNRFPDSDEPAGPAIMAGDELEVILRDETQLRVKVDGEFCWVPTAKVSDIDPEPAETLQLPVFPGIE
jgi:hypothetical protein